MISCSNLLGGSISGERERKKEDNRDPRSIIILNSQQWELSLADILASKGKWTKASSDAGFKYKKETPNNRQITSLNMGWTTLQYDRYYGYLLVLFDVESNVLAIDSDQPKLRSQVPEILKAEEEEELFRVGLKE